MKISVTVMAHPKRKQQAQALLDQLKTYPFVKATITWDQINEEWHTGARSLRAGVKTGSDYHVVIQDDAILAPNFYTHLENAISVVPQRSLISLYTGTARPMPDRVASAVARAKGCSWLKSNLLYWGVGIAIPTNHIAELLDFVADRTEPYDFRIGWAYMRQAIPVYYTNPSLVDHDDGLGSLLDHGNGPDARVAHNFVGDNMPHWNNRTLEI